MSPPPGGAPQRTSATGAPELQVSVDLREVPGVERALSIADACARWSPRPALTQRDHTITYAQLWQQVLGLAAGYRSLGVRPGDRIVTQLPTCPQHLVAAAAAWECGAIHVGVDKDLTGRELFAVVRRTQARAVVVAPPPDAPALMAALDTLRAKGVATILHATGVLPHGAIRLSDLIAEQPATALGSLPAQESGQEHTDLLLFTSGTTGQAKAVRETLSALWAKAEFFAQAVQPRPDDVHLHMLPLSHAFGLKLALMALGSGGRLVLMQRFSPQAALELVGREGVTVLPGTPTHLTLLLSHLDPAQHDVARLRWAVSAAAPLPPALIEGMYDRLGVELLYVYGCSEGFVALTTDHQAIAAGSVGKQVFSGPAGTPADGTVHILAPLIDGTEVMSAAEGVSLPAGEVGEIAFGASRPVRYWDDPPAATNGLYRTGDLGFLDPLGRLYVTGRLTDVVNRGGLKVAAGEVEAVLARQPGVAECAVVATPDPILGEAICACVVMDAGLPAPQLADLRDALAQDLARHKLPDELCLLPALPRSRIGKLDRPALVAAVLADDCMRERWRP